MIDRIIAFVFVVVGSIVLIKYLAPVLGEFQTIAVVIIAIIGIILGLYILAGQDVPKIFNRN